jgi:hypothetical protein
LSLIHKLPNAVLYSNRSILYSSEVKLSQLTLQTIYAIPTMSLTVAAGAKSLLSLGVSLGDVALLYDWGRKFGNFLRAAKNEEEFLESIMEEPEALLKRRGLVELVRMESVWNIIEAVYEGERISNESKPDVASKQNLSALSWLMIAIVSALDLCLPSTGIHTLIVEVFHDLLRPATNDSQLRRALQVQLPTNIQSWRDVGRVRGLDKKTVRQMTSCRAKLTETNAIPQLNPAELKESKEFLVWLMEGRTHSFTCVSATVFSMASAIQHTGIRIRTEGIRAYETEPVISYASQEQSHNSFEAGWLGGENHPGLARGLGSRAQIIAFPCGKPESMVETVELPRSVKNRMSMLWKLGSEAAAGFHIHASANIPFSFSSEVSYSIENSDASTSRYAPHLMMLAHHAFPAATEGVLKALEDLLEGIEQKLVVWLQQHTAAEFLSRTEASMPDRRSDYMELWTQYQALVLGFYYRLFEPLLVLESVSKDAFFRGVWGLGSTTSLAAFTEFNHVLMSHGSVTRTHVLYLLSMMYGGRTQRFSRGSSASGLLGVLGPISIICMPLHRVTDIPQEIAMFAFADLPIIDLASDAEGEIYAGKGCDVQFAAPPDEPEEIQPHGPEGKWSVHAKMSMLFGETKPGVVMAARCNGRPVGWFSPLAADVTFLSEAYQQKRHSGEVGYVDSANVRGFSVRDEHWERAQPLRATAVQDNAADPGLVHSRGNAALRYAAAGIYASVGEEVAIATDDIDQAVGRVKGQGISGIVIS